MIIIIDKREKNPLQFDCYEFALLRYGDYSLKYLENEIAIERKSLDDFTRSISGENRARFEQRIKEAKSALKFYVLVIEASYFDLYNEKNWYGNISSRCIRGTISKWMVKYNIPIILAGNHTICAEIVHSMLEGYQIYNKNIYKTMYVGGNNVSKMSSL